MKHEELWAIFRNFIDEIDAGTKTTSQVRKAMLKMQNEERYELDGRIADGTTDRESDRPSANLPENETQN